MAKPNSRSAKPKRGLNLKERGPKTTSMQMTRSAQRRLVESLFREFHSAHLLQIPSTTGVGVPDHGKEILIPDSLSGDMSDAQSFLGGQHGTRG